MGQAPRRRRAGLTDVVFTRGPARRYRSRLRRADGALVELEGGSWNRVGGPAGEVPHDIAHLVVEGELGLDRGVWGVLVAGGLFAGATLVPGHGVPHGERKGRALIAGWNEPLNQAEVVVRVVGDMALAGADPDPAAFARACGDRWRVPATREELARCCERLRRHGAEWAALAPGGQLTLRWP